MGPGLGENLPVGGPERVETASGTTGGLDTTGLGGDGGGGGGRLEVFTGMETPLRNEPCTSQGAAPATFRHGVAPPGCAIFGAPLYESSTTMSVREFIALGTGSQVPTRRRNHNGYFLRWDDEGFLFDPGEGTQRQMTFGDLPARAIHRIFITHFHGDHCLGLAGIIQRLSLDRCDHPVTVHYPASGEQYFQRLRHASIYHPCVELVPAPVTVPDEGTVLIGSTDAYTLHAHRLDHPVPTVGYRVEERPGRRFVPERLRALGLAGPLIGELSARGSVTVGDRTITLDEASVPKEGSAVAFVMDTRACPGAVALARDADLLVMEATYSAADQALADAHGHASSVDAARTARDAGARRLALTHFSQRYESTADHVREAKEIFPHTVALDDLMRLPIPRRR